MYWFQVKLNTCEPELEMFTRYSKLLAGYMRGVGTDLTTDVSPPKCLYIEVRAVTNSKRGNNLLLVAVLHLFRLAV